MPSQSAGPAPRSEPQRRRRADAQRNYDLLVAAARDIFHDHGVDAPLDDIARRAASVTPPCIGTSRRVAN